METTNKGWLHFSLKNSAYSLMYNLQCVPIMLMTKVLNIKIAQECNVTPQVTATK
jgi:hypothetical protein